MFLLVDDTAPRPPWNKGKLIGEKKTPQAQGNLDDPGPVADG
jgi:hypothetical protein